MTILEVKNPNEIGPYLKRYRESKDITQVQLARMLSIMPKTISDFETGKSIPTPMTWYRIARALGIDEIRIEIV